VSSPRSDDPATWARRDLPSVPALLSAALQRYGREIRAELATAGYGDLPPGGSWLLGALAGGPRTSVELAAVRRQTKQAVSRLVDSAVSRGYLERLVDDTDRRRVPLRLTDRGRAAGTVAGAVSTRLTRELTADLSGSERQALRTALAGFALADERSAPSGSAPSDLAP
jgi:DNA-binding MarR family transcriptional regulator